MQSDTEVPDYGQHAFAFKASRTYNNVTSLYKRKYYIISAVTECLPTVFCHGRKCFHKLRIALCEASSCPPFFLLNSEGEQPRCALTNLPKNERFGKSRELAISLILLSE